MKDEYKVLNQRRRQCIVHYACLRPYSELKDVNEKR